MKRPNIGIVIKNEQERLEFLATGVDLHSSQMTADGEVVSFYMEEDDPRWESVMQLIRKRLVAQAADLKLKNRSLSDEATTLSTEMQGSHFKWLTGYSGQTFEQLISLEGEYRIDSLVLAFEQAIGQKVAREGRNRITDEERVVLAVEALEREVNNGGYDQFFRNSSREFAPFIVDSLQRIGCEQTAKITHMAIEAFSVPTLTARPIDAAMRAADEALQKNLSRFDDAYIEPAKQSPSGSLHSSRKTKLGSNSSHSRVFALLRS